MEIRFYGDTEGLEEGISILSRRLGLKETADGLPVRVEKIGENRIEVGKSSEGAVIRYQERIHFFRALGLFVEECGERERFRLTEYPQFQTDGVMIDISQNNAVINEKNLKRLLELMALMGLNLFMLYAEDSYRVEGEPYFGYMRGRYTREELKEVDDYAYALGIEVVPCVQTLAHLIDVLKWECYWGIRDDDDTLLVGEPGTYELIERLLSSASAPFRSKRIHIGMDEAFRLGQGEYLLQNGLKPKFDIMNEHLGKVMEIVEKLGLRPMIWSDMYFRAASRTGDYYDRDVEFSPEMLAGVPKNVQLVYWDYEHQEKETYASLIARHREFGSTPVFAGGVWCWNGYTVDYDKTFATTEPALEACKESGVREVVATLWGDGGCESNVYASLLGMQLYAEHGYARQLDPEKLKKRFRFCTGCGYEDFIRMTLLDKLPGMKTEEGWKYTNPSRYLMWQDPLLGLFDKNVEGLGMGVHYAGLAEAFRESAGKSGEFGFLFRFLEKTASVLSVKSEVGIALEKAYRSGDREELKRLAGEVLPELRRKVRDLRSFHRRLWMDVCKPVGWEVLDIRYGGLLARLETAEERLGDYLRGETDSLEELEQERLYFGGKPGLAACNLYSRICSASRLSYSTAF